MAIRAKNPAKRAPTSGAPRKGVASTMAVKKTAVRATVKKIAGAAKTTKKAAASRVAKASAPRRRAAASQPELDMALKEVRARSKELTTDIDALLHRLG
jgi:hypothetical protein